MAGNPEAQTILEGPGQVTWHAYAPLSGLTPESSYDLAVRISDTSGAVAVTLEDRASPDGWWPWGRFDQGPCVSRACACMPSGELGCDHDWQCCSGSCGPSPPQGLGVPRTRCG